MSAASVFASLQELFPQVDSRILRAISIEHREDINEAVEYILSEFSLSEATRSESHISLEGSEGVEHIAGLKDDPTSSLDTLHCIGEAENTKLNSLVSDSTEEPGLLPSQSLHVDANPRSKQRVEASDHNNNLSLNISHLLEKVDEVSLNNADNQQVRLELHSDRGFDEVFLTEHHTKFSDGLECACSSQHVNVVEACHHEDNIPVNFVDQTNLSAVYDKNGSTDACRPLNLFDLETAVNTQTANTSILSVSAVDENDQIYHSATEEYTDIIDSENQNLISFDEKSTELLSKENENSNILLLSLPTRSGHSVAIDLLEDYIQDAKTSKKTLLSTLESMANKMQEVELLEERAKQVKADDVVASHDILSKVEELQKILKQSKDMNDMHAGEIYGERSILAAEARELQSRLLKMSDERNKYLSITEELFRSLEARIAAAENEIAAAELEKLEREKAVHESLKDHELMMESALAESLKLQQEAEENSKLRDFLMERGRAVDSLQGEIAIICEDILSMKLKVEGGHTPISKFLRSYSADHTPSALSSSTTSTTNEIIEKHPIVKDSTDPADLTNIGRISLDDWELCET